MGLHDRILVATDLTARSDRALDRARLLAGPDASRLCVLHVVEGGRNAREPASIRDQIRMDLGAAADRAVIRVEEGDPATIIRDVARAHAATLVVAGITRTEWLGRTRLGHTVERLLRTDLPALLLVTERARTDYARVAVAIDFSQASTDSVALTAGLVPRQPITVLHVSEALATYGAADIEAHREAFRQGAESSYAEWLARAGLPAATRQRLRPQILQGEPAKALRDAAEANRFDLVVLATHGHRALFEFFVGSIAKRMLAELSCDALLIRASRSAAAAKIPVAAPSNS